MVQPNRCFVLGNLVVMTVKYSQADWLVPAFNEHLVVEILDWRHGEMVSVPPAGFCCMFLTNSWFGHNHLKSYKLPSWHTGIIVCMFLYCSKNLRVFLYWRLFWICSTVLFYLVFQINQTFFALMDNCACNFKSNNVFCEWNTRSVVSIFEVLHETNGIKWWYVTDRRGSFEEWQVLKFYLFAMFKESPLICRIFACEIYVIRSSCKQSCNECFFFFFQEFFVKLTLLSSLQFSKMSKTSETCFLSSEGEVITCRDCGEIFKDRVSLHKHQLFSCNNSRTDFGQHHNISNDEVNRYVAQLKYFASMTISLLINGNTELFLMDTIFSFTLFMLEGKLF